MTRSILLLLLFIQPALSQEFNLPELNEKLAEARDQNDFEKLSEVYLLLGIYEEENLKNHDKAFEFYTRSLEYSKVVGDSNRYFTVKEKLANQFRRNDQFEEAISNYKEAKDYYIRNGNESKLSYVFLNISKCYADNESLEEQEEYLNQVASSQTIKTDTILNVSYLFERIRYNEYLNQYDETQALANQAFELSTEIEHQPYQAKALFILGQNQVKIHEYEKAIPFLSEGLELSGSSPFDPLRLDIYDNLSKAHNELENFQDAFTYVKMYSLLHDSILNRDRIEAVNNLTFKYETRQKNNEIELLNKNNEIVLQRNDMQKRALYVLAVGLLLLMVTLYFIVQYYRQRIKATRIINQQREEINVRKINDLENDVKIKSMQSMIEGQELERERIAKDLHDSLGGLLSTIKLQFEKAKSKKQLAKENLDYNNAQELLDTAVDEVRIISRNLQPGSLRNMGLVAATNDLINRYTGDTYPDIHFQYYDVPEKLNGMVSTSIYRIIQELFNNAIKYAKAKEIIIQLNKVEDEIVISFEDDGIGFDTNNPNPGMGLENIKSRVQYLKGNMQIDSEKDIGTSYLIHVKYEDV